MGIAILGLHEGMHVFYPGLELHPRYLSPATIFISIAFVILVFSALPDVASKTSFTRLLFLSLYFWNIRCRVSNDF